MTTSLLLDTHIALWLDSGDPRLRPETRELIDASWTRGGSIYLSAVSAWEIALLADLGRIHLDISAPSWIERFLGRPGLTNVPLGWRAAAGAYQLGVLEHRDPADRMLMATAIDLECPLVTYDARIADFAAVHGRRIGLALATEA
jgi:PIN domain nuclease of toxin-antitoxin system